MKPMPLCFPIIRPPKMVWHAVLLAAACVFSCSAGAASFRVVGIADGDTITVLDDDKQMIKCRLYGIDAPEKAQPYGAQSKASLSELAFQRIAEIGFAGRDRYGRSICKVTVDGLDVNREQLLRGMAWMYRRYTGDASYDAAEVAARAAGRGLWRDSQAVPPWDFRRRD
jgi:endonuclease YncB( thermonuclease family)